MEHIILIAKGGGGGARGGGGASRSTGGSKSTGSKSSGSSGTGSTKSSPSTSKYSAKTTTTAKKPSSGRYSSEGRIIDDTYRPNFSSGYVPPSGSVVYYPQSSFIDYLPWYYLFTQNNANSADRTVVEPSGKEMKVAESRDFDGLVIVEWIFLLAIVAAVIGLLWWVFRKWLSGKESYA